MTRRFFWTALILGIIALAVTAACGGDDDGASTDGGATDLTVVTTLPLFADMVSNVAGGGVDVTALLPSGADPHTYEPPPQDVARLEGADIIFMNGFDLEPTAERLIDANGGNATVVRLGEQAAAAGAGVLSGDDEEPNNPHLWMSVDSAQLYVDAIRDALDAADPANATTYDANANTYRAALNDLDTYVRDTVDTVPEQNRKLVTTHDAFPYLAAYIGFEITAVLVESPGQDVNPDAVRQVMEAVQDAGVPAVFSEPQLGSDTSLLDQVASDTGAEVCTLYSDSLDDAVKTYIDLMRHNADEIARCLGGASGG